jgi:hypothetical protein
MPKFAAGVASDWEDQGASHWLYRVSCWEAVGSEGFWMFWMLGFQEL